MSIRVLIADDHKVILEGLRGLLELEGDIKVIGEASNGREAVELARQLGPDIVVMDVTMPDLNGIVATEEILREVDEIKVIGLSVHNSGQIVLDMIRAGASGYVVKSASVEEVIRAIHIVADGGTYYSSSVAVEVDRDAARRSKRRRTETGSALSAREREVLQLVAEGKGSKQIARILHVTTKTVSWHRQSIMDKLGMRSVAELTKYCIREGITPLDC